MEYRTQKTGKKVFIQKDTLAFLAIVGVFGYYAYEGFGQISQPVLSGKRAESVAMVTSTPVVEKPTVKPSDTMAVSTQVFENMDDNFPLDQEVLDDLYGTETKKHVAKAASIDVSAAENAQDLSFNDVVLPADIRYLADLYEDICKTCGGNVTNSGVMVCIQNQIRRMEDRFPQDSDNWKLEEENAYLNAHETYADIYNGVLNGKEYVTALRNGLVRLRAHLDDQNQPTPPVVQKSGTPRFYTDVPRQRD